MIDPETLFSHLVPVLLLMLSVDLGVAFMMRGAKHAAGEGMD